MYLDKLIIRNFQCFGPNSQHIKVDRRLTAFLGANAAGKTAACQALLRLFSVVPEQRQVRVEDFHVPQNETTMPALRTLTVEAVFAFPELQTDDKGQPDLPNYEWDDDEDCFDADSVEDFKSTDGRAWQVPDSRTTAF
uniref:AAA family ATPase n=1 Tax=Rhodococcus sp. H36-A4 TaxID=3004353 RepID=UPI003FA6BAEC